MSDSHTPNMTLDDELSSLRQQLEERDKTLESMCRQLQRLNESQHATRVGSFETGGDQDWWSDELYCILCLDAQHITPSLERLIERIHSSERAEVLQALNTVQINGVPVELECRVALPEEKILHCQLVARPILDAAGHCIRLTGDLQDITNVKNAEEERLSLEAQFRQMQKLESLGTMAGGIAHDFNNLLLGILGNAELALLELSESHPATESVSAIQVSATRAAELVKQMLTYSGKGRYDSERLRLDELVQDLSELLKASISKKHTLEFQLEARAPEIEGDASQLRQVVGNLVTNASDALGESSGTITVQTGVMYCDEQYLTDVSLHHELPKGRYCFIEVRDTGPGIEPKSLDRIFDPFFTTRFTGRGLGLAAVHGIVAAHHGGIAVESTPDEGCTFTILIPPVEKVRKRTTPPAPPLTHLNAGGTILLVDDEAPVRSVARRMLERLGFYVVMAFDGQHALELFKQSPQKYCCVLLDLTMPHMDGIECFAQLKKIRDDAIVLLSSGYSERELSKTIREQGFNGFIQKPYKLVALAERLALALGPHE